MTPAPTRVYRDHHGEFSVRPVEPAADATLLHSWVTHPKATFWMMADASVADVEREYRRIADDRHHEAFLGLVDGVPAFLMERYDPARVELVGVHAAEPGDVGMHFLVAPTDRPKHGFTRSVLRAVLSAIFADDTVRRVVVEPDIRNTAVHRLNAAVGFTPLREVALPAKTALLSICTREDFTNHESVEMTTPYRTPAHTAVAHLNPHDWAAANRLLLTKALSEFSHERLLEPIAQDGERWTITAEAGRVVYSFAAERLPLDHWQIDADSVTCTVDGAPRPLDLMQCVLDFRTELGLSDQVLPVYLEEIASTLSAVAFKLSGTPPTSRELLAAGFQAIEAGMLSGHPCFIANSGRVGWGVHEYQAFAPESGQPVRLLWLAARRDLATFTCSRDTSYDEFIRGELGAQVDDFAGQLRAHDLDPDDYRLIPVHPWQWWNKLSVTFAAEVAGQRLVLLGEGRDAYRAQQSVRTFFNTSDPSKHYVKTALSVINMGFMRGLSAAYMEATPAINDWLADLIAADDTLKRTGVGVIRERAAIGYHATQFEQATDRYSPYRKMLAALWRESPVPQLEPGRKLSTMAALLHVDADGQSVAGALIDESGLTPAQWLRGYLDAYLVPLLHCFYRYGLVFMPHGENVILVLNDGAVERVVMKDLAEEIAVMSPDTPLPEAVERVRADVPEQVQLLSIFTDVFDCFLRHLSAILHQEGLIAADDFWATVAQTAADYQCSEPDLRARFEQFDLFAEEFALSCLNRLQLRDNQQMVDLADPAGALQLVGTLRNPIAGFNS
ncbi:GNAT family N-acetyltransferase [Flexivirga sp. ID2601S]|uniref:Lysine N-acyltransferase MbtK n=1 Tax=Flexivirga aerilata TaxID=1656889 RepID=A0A849AR27_9MICO|nr:GNAT family N-acetyltransferase [Flexivirga aerilata]NNG39222.1 GNAT family N-acetyltransferase [Flexivirga aerilata]